MLIKFEDGEETDELKFDGTKLIYQYAGTTYTLVRATDAQAQLYKEASDAWHGGADESKLNVDNYKPKGVDHSQWMKPLNDSRLVADLSLPGSHDACTAEGWNNALSTTWTVPNMCCVAVTVLRARRCTSAISSRR